MASSNIDRDTLEREIENITVAIAQGGQLTSLLDALTVKHAAREALTTTMAAFDAADLTGIDRATVAREVRAMLDDWQSAVGGAVDRTRQACGSR